MNESNLHPYQLRASKFQCTTHTSMLWIDMGLGKTIITLTSIAKLIEANYLRGVLVVAPMIVAQTVWMKEAAKWDHTRHLKFSLILGDKDQRARALLQKADIYVINYENLKWLSDVLNHFFVKKGQDIPFNGLVWDEVNKMKNSTSERVKSTKKILSQFNWTTGLTGTPASNGYKDLHGQYLVVDGGQRLGVSKTAFTNSFYYTIPGTFTKVPFKDSESRIKELIGDITLEMSAEEYNPLPKMIVNDIWIDLPKDLLLKYKQLEEEFFFQVDSTDIEVFNVVSMMNKCLQFANGSVYPIPGLPVFKEVHDLKLNVLADIVDQSNGSPVLCAYPYKGDAERIKKKLGAVNLTELTSKPKLLQNALAKWQISDIPLMIGHPASMGHGIDGLQQSGHTLVWFGLNWSLDYYKQFNARLVRQGQTKPVVCHRILIKNTLDEVQALRLNDKDESEEAIKKAIREYRGK